MTERKVSRISVISEKVVISETSFRKASHSDAIVAKDLEAAEGGKEVRHPTTYMETMVHIIKANIGSGMFAMGDAFKNAGILLGPLLTVGLGFLCVFAQHQLLDASDGVAKRLGLSYSPDFAETVQHSFSFGPPIFRRCANIARRLVNVFLVATQIGFCSVYFVFIASNLKDVLDQYIAEIDARIYMLIIFVPILLSSWVRTLKYMVPVSLISNILMCGGIAITLYMCVHEGLPPLSERRLAADWHQLPLYFGTVVYCYEAISLTIPLKNEMKKPEQFSMPLGVLNMGSTFIGFLLISMGTLSYWQFGDAVKGSVTLNLDQKSHLCQAIKLAICMGLLLTYAIQAYVPVELMWPHIERKLSPMKHPVAAEILFRSVIVVFTLLLAESVPKIGLFISLVGAVSSAGLALIFPPLLDWAWRWDQGMSVARHIINLTLLLLGVLGCVWGTYASLEEIINAFVSGDVNAS